jgi:hypothetical protein
MKSGDFSVARDDEYHRKEFAQIFDRQFVQQTFASHAALLAKEPVNNHRILQDYHGEPYDASKFDLVEEGWDHEHCSVCFFTVKDGHTYWENGDRIKLLCDACYETFVKT